MDGRFITYYRVSTAEQGRSGLGLEAQRTAVEDWLNGGRHTVLAEFIEIESGRRSDRPKLAEALALCRRKKATLVIAKLDRLARNVAFIANLMESGVPFVAVDRPHAKPFELHIYAAMAEEEARQISARTKAALAAAKARGVVLGNPNLADQRGRAIESNRGHADARAAKVAPMLLALQRDGLSLNAIARELNQRGVPTITGGTTWYAAGVSRVLERVKAAGTVRR
jgi:DNA invertase Pin-like site-specific DNA recombinase